MSEENNIKDMALVFKALGEPSRLKIFKFLCSCCESFSVDEENNVRPVNGVSVGEICCNITGESIISSTMSHHFKELRNAGLINMERSGKNILCSINIQKVSQISKFLSGMSICCVEKEKNLNEDY